jgi:hypothetical protein
MTMLTEVVDAVIGIDTHRDSHEVEMAHHPQAHRHSLRRGGAPVADPRKRRRGLQNGVPNEQGNGGCRWEFGNVMPGGNSFGRNAQYGSLLSSS